MLFTNLRAQRQKKKNTHSPVGNPLFMSHVTPSTPMSVCRLSCCICCFNLFYFYNEPSNPGNNSTNKCHTKKNIGSGTKDMNSGGTKNAVKLNIETGCPNSPLRPARVRHDATFQTWLFFLALNKRPSVHWEKNMKKKNKII